MATTHDIQMQGCREEWVPTEAEVPADHWSKSSEWVSYLRAKADAVRLYPIGSVNAGRIADTPEMQAALEKFQAKFPPEDPEPTPVLDARTAELRAAEIDLRRAVQRLRIFAHPDRIIGLVQRMVSE